jgi:hypothetical protein
MQAIYLYAQTGKATGLIENGIECCLFGHSGIFRV